MPDTIVFAIGGTAHLTVVSLGVLGSYIVLASLADLRRLPAIVQHYWSRRIREVHFELALPLCIMVFLLYTLFTFLDPFYIIPPDELPAEERSRVRARKVVSFKPPLREARSFFITWFALHADHVGQVVALVLEMILAGRKTACSSLSMQSCIVLDTLFIVYYLLLNGIRWVLVGKPCYPFQELWRSQGKFKLLQMHALLSLTSIVLASGPIRSARSAALDC